MVAHGLFLDDCSFSQPNPANTCRIVIFVTVVRVAKHWHFAAARLFGEKGMFRPEGSQSRVQVDGGEHLPQMRQGVTPCGPSKSLKRPDQPCRARSLRCCCHSLLPRLGSALRRCLSLGQDRGRVDIRSSAGNLCTEDASALTSSRCLIRDR